MLTMTSADTIDRYTRTFTAIKKRNSDRQASTAIEVLKLSARDDIQEFVSASAITDIYYIAYKNLRDKAAVRELLKKLLLIVSVAGVSEEEIQKALELEWNDFEDSVQYSVAALNEMDGIITRNVKDYSSAEMQERSSFPLSFAWSVPIFWFFCIGAGSLSGSSVSHVIVSVFFRRYLFSQSFSESTACIFSMTCFGGYPERSDFCGYGSSFPGAASVTGISGSCGSSGSIE